MGRLLTRRALKPDDDGKVRFTNCPRCDEIVITAVIGGERVSLSRRSIPLSDARAVARYHDRVWNIWPARIGLFGVLWSQPTRPSRGRLYTEHLCGRWV